MWGRLKTTLRALSSVPEGFELHPKLQPLLESRKRLLEGRGPVSWATAEALAFGTLLLEGVAVRLSGQDSRRGTFNQRHAVLYDVKTGREHIPLADLAHGAARFEVHDSLLSEAAVMGFEYGYSVAEHEALVLWEAQFGDFANGAQVVIDQFLSGSEQKWGQPTDLVLLLPHGYEGQGPEHSSARLERFLILCAEHNLRVCQPTTPAQYFHLLRRQARDPEEKPLVVLTPKSLLRHAASVSALPELAEGEFATLLDDLAADPSKVRRVVLTSGRLYFDLLQMRTDRRAEQVALIRLEQLYPFPGEKLAGRLERFSRDVELVWAQDEPRNMGAWRFVRERFLDGDVRGAFPPRFAGRPESASPAAGSHTLHSLEQQALLRQVFGD
jgi:2-oxoglutarate dehydrogenase E1 component